MDHGQHQDGQGACHRERSIPMDIPGRETRRSCESAIGQPPRPLNLLFFLAMMILHLGTNPGTCAWSPPWEVRSRAQTRCRLSRLPIPGPLEI